MWIRRLCKVLRPIPWQTPCVQLGCSLGAGASTCGVLCHCLFQSFVFLGQGAALVTGEQTSSPCTQGAVEGRDVAVPCCTHEAQQQGGESAWPGHHFPYWKWQSGKSLGSCCLNQVSGKGQILVWLNSGHFTGVRRGMWICA